MWLQVQARPGRRSVTIPPVVGGGGEKGLAGGLRTGDKSWLYFKEGTGSEQSR